MAFSSPQLLPTSRKNESPLPVYIFSYGMSNSQTPTHVNPTPQCSCVPLPVSLCLKLSKPQLNHNSTQPNITLSWVRHENDFAHHPTPPPTHTNSMSAISQLLLIPQTYLSSLVKIVPGTAEILMTLSFCGGGGGWWWSKVSFVSNPTFALI